MLVLVRPTLMISEVIKAILAKMDNTTSLFLLLHLDLVLRAKRLQNDCVRGGLKKLFWKGLTPLMSEEVKTFGALLKTAQQNFFPYFTM